MTIISEPPAWGTPQPDLQLEHEPGNGRTDHAPATDRAPTTESPAVIFVNSGNGTQIIAQTVIYQYAQPQRSRPRPTPHYQQGSNGDPIMVIIIFVILIAATVMLR